MGSARLRLLGNLRVYPLNELILLDRSVLLEPMKLQALCSTGERIYCYSVEGLHRGDGDTWAERGVEIQGSRLSREIMNRIESSCSLRV